MDTDLRHTLRSAALHVARLLGLFALAQYLTRRQLRILCYHGLSLGDEHEALPHMFMRRETFERRMRILKKRRIPVIALRDAVELLAAGAIRQAQAVITFDDGWASSLTLAAPVLERFGYPACVYVTTEHLTAGTEVFNVALEYMLRRSSRRTLQLDGVHQEIDGSYQLHGDPVALRIRLVQSAQRAYPDLAERQKLLRPIARALGMDLDEVLADGRFRLLDGAQMAALHRRGMAIELHTHSHRLPDDSFEAMAEEITRNREALQSILATVPEHFCYPSGEYSAQHPGWLRKLGIVSATTCDPGLNGRGADPLQLRRYLDGDHVADIAFEAEVCGLRHLARTLRSLARRSKGGGG